jgi:hypothetical protein
MESGKMFKLLVTDYASFRGAVMRTTVLEFNSKEEADIAFARLDAYPFGADCSFMRNITKLY